MKFITKKLKAEGKSGNPAELGATVNGASVNFAVSVPGASEVILHLYKAGEAEPVISVSLGETEKTGSVYAVNLRLESEDPCTLEYDYETKGERFNDPYTRLLRGRDRYGHRLTASEQPFVRSAIRANRFRWNEEHRPKSEMSNLLLYKLHVRGFTKESGSRAAGTYLGVAGKAGYLKTLGINAVLLMPVTEYNECFRDGDRPEGIPDFRTSSFYRENPLAASAVKPAVQDTEEPEETGPVNFWGYSGQYFLFAPKASYAADPAQADNEFRGMVKKLHQNGIEVLMEMMIPEHTNRSMVLDALRFWVREYHVDGFRINGNIDAEMIACDPYLYDVKLLGSDWNIERISSVQPMPEPPHLAVCNDRYSELTRKFLKGDEGVAESFADIFLRNTAGCGNIRYITDHNGFTLNDLYMYDVKHNEANGEQGRDGTDYNFSWNCGVEGPDKHKKIRDLRMKMKKNAICAMMLSQGTPMILAGDEFGNSQNGNNNAYNQDNPTGWINWSEQRKNSELQSFFREMIALRKAHPVFHNPLPLQWKDSLYKGIPDVSVHGKEVWKMDHSPYNRSIGILLNGEYVRKDDKQPDDSFYLMFNMYWEEQSFAVPILSGHRWVRVLATDTSCAEEPVENRMTIPPRSIVLLQSTAEKKSPERRAKQPKKTTRTTTVER